MKNIKRLCYIILLMLIFILFGTVESKAGNLKLNNLDFDVQINEDGTMDVIENWDIYISNTNTLYKSFKTDSSKYSGISNVKVREKTLGRESYLKKQDEWEYHVTKGYYYGTENDDGDFEIGWGVGLDSSSATRQYEISYTVYDAITKYNDYAELYWQFIGEDFEINAAKITGTIYLPSNVSNMNDIKVWGHTEDLNGTIYATDYNKIQFDLNNFRNGRYVEIRTLFPTSLITYSGRTKNKEVLSSVIKEETKWADKANARRKRNEMIKKYLPVIFFIGWVFINVLLIVIYTKKVIKYKKRLKELAEKLKPSMQMEYFRDLPDEDLTPGEAVKLLNIYFDPFTPTGFGKIFSANLLNLTLKGYIELEQENQTKFGKNNLKIKIKKNVDKNIDVDESLIMLFILGATKGSDELELDDLKKYIKNNPYKIEKLINNCKKNVDIKLINRDIIDKDVQEEYKKYRGIQMEYIFSSILMVSFTFIAFIIPIIIFIINAILCGKIAKKLNVLTQKGVDKEQEIKGLKKFMEDFSRLDKREIPELIIWEKYLVYATAFGIADKVIKQLKIVYPNFEELSNGVATYTYMNLMMNTDFSSSISHSISSSISSAYSSGSGGGGGFSGRRRRWPEAGGGGGRKIRVSFW